MERNNNMNKIWLVDNNPAMVEAWSEVFKDVPAADLEVVHDDIRNFLSTHPSIGFAVSPANSYGIMTGGYDLALANYFDPISIKANGNPLQNWVQLEIASHGNYVPIGSCLPVYIPGLPQTLFVVPTMRRPSVIADPSVVFDCMISTLACWCHTKEVVEGVNDIVIPAFGALTGELDPMVVAKMMQLGVYIFGKDVRLDWQWANTVDKDLAAAQL